MKKLIKKSTPPGPGAASVTKEKVGRLLADFAEKKAITAKEGKRLAKEFLNELVKNKERIERLSRIEAELLKNKAKNLENRLVKRGGKTAKKILSRAAKELE